MNVGAPMAELLVTGGAGFIGANFVRFWRERRPRDTIVVLDALTYAGNRASLNGIADVRLVHGDVRDEALVARLLVEHGLDTIVHFAAESHVDRSISGPEAFIDTNVLGTHALLKAARRVWLDRGTGRPHRFHHISTDEVYGSLEADEAAFTEASPARPNSPYAASKAASDMLVRAYNRTYGLQTSITNCSNNYGPYQYPEKLIPFFVTNALHGRPLPIYGDGLNRRDWLHVADHCEAIALVLAGGTAGETYNVGGGAELANIDVIDIICSTIDRAFAEDPSLAARFSNAPAARGEAIATLRRFVTDRPGHDRRYAVDCTLLEATLGYVPRHGFAEHFETTLRWYLAREDWWRPLAAAA